MTANTVNTTRGEGLGQRIGWKLATALRVLNGRLLVARLKMRMMLMSGGFRALAMEAMLAEGRAFERCSFRLGRFLSACAKRMCDAESMGA